MLGVSNGDSLSSIISLVESLDSIGLAGSGVASISLASVSLLNSSSQSVSGSLGSSGAKASDSVQSGFELGLHSGQLAVGDTVVAGNSISSVQLLLQGLKSLVGSSGVLVLVTVLENSLSLLDQSIDGIVQNIVDVGQAGVLNEALVLSDSVNQLRIGLSGGFCGEQSLHLGQSSLGSFIVVSLVQLVDSSLSGVIRSQQAVSQSTGGVAIVLVKSQIGSSSLHSLSQSGVHSDVSSRGVNASFQSSVQSILEIGPRSRGVIVGIDVLGSINSLALVLNDQSLNRFHVFDELVIDSVGGAADDFRIVSGVDQRSNLGALCFSSRYAQASAEHRERRGRSQRQSKNSLFHVFSSSKI